MSVVVDASLAGAWLLPDENSEQAEDVLEAVIRGEEEMIVPDLWIYEMAYLLLSAHRRARITESQVLQAQDLLESIPRTTYDHHALLTQNRLVRLSVRFGLSAYDAAYLELADRVQCPLRTGDRSLHAAAKSLGLGADP
jgi:predicted nucleic acid-binding protein